MLDFRVRSTAKQPTDNFSGRRKFLVVFMMACMLVLTGRAIDLQVLNKLLESYLWEDSNEIRNKLCAQKLTKILTKTNLRFQVQAKKVPSRV